MLIESRTLFVGVVVMLCLPMLVSTGGCGKTMVADDKPTEKLVPVKGQATFDGKPMVNAMVTFHPVGSTGKSKTPFGIVGADGAFSLGSYLPNDGAPAGEFAVTVTWTQPVNGTSSDDISAVELLPPKYQRPDSSGLKVKVVEGSAEPIELKLTR